MLVFQSIDDLKQLSRGDHARPLVRSILNRLIQVHAPYDPEAHGYVVLIQPHDVHRQRILPMLPYALARVPWEGVTLVAGFFHAVVVTNNTFAIDFVIPDADWLTETLRASLEEYLT